MTEILTLSGDFPPVSTEAWEAAIAKDLKGADYDKKLVWRTEEGIAVRPYYRRENIAGLDARPVVPVAHEFTPGPAAIRADLLHESGAHAVQELAYALAAGVERFSAGESMSEIEFVFAIGSNYFFEIAKLRAARLLCAQVMAAFGRSCALRIAARTSRRNKSLYDRYTNLLRATTEALSATIGGCDHLTVEPCGFAPRTAVNVGRILTEESHLDVVADPAAGSYYIESLTDALARAAWKLFQQVEAAGGYTAAQDSIRKAIEETRAAREKAYSSRRRVLVGVNNYPNLTEKTPDAELPPGARIAEPFEKIRRRTAEHARATGRYPKVLLLKRGDVKMKGARANFCLNFFGCAGFDMVEAEEYEDTDADLIVLCSSDPEYLAFAQEVCPKVKVPVLVAGNPKEQIG